MSRLVSGAEDDSNHTTSIVTPNNSIHLKIPTMQIKQVTYFLHDYRENKIVSMQLLFYISQLLSSFSST